MITRSHGNNKLISNVRLKSIISFILLLVNSQSWLSTSLKLVLSFSPIVILWILLVRMGVWSADLFPGPGAVFASFLELINKGILPEFIRVSVSRLILGLVVGGIPAIFIGIALGRIKGLLEAIEPTLAFFQAIAEIAWIPLCIIWFGFGIETMVFIIVYTVFFPTVFNTITGVRTIPQRIIDATRTLGAKQYHILFEVILPGALPSIMTGLRLGTGYAWRALIAGEMIIGEDGLGYMIFSARQYNQTPRIMVGLIVMGLLWLITDRLILKPIEQRTIERWGLVAE